MIDLGQFWKQHAEWSQKTFGSDLVRGPEGPLRHLALEVQECLANPGDIEEYADLILLSFDATRRAGFDYSDLVMACFKKLEKNARRKWGAASSDQPVEHIREGES